MCSSDLGILMLSVLSAPSLAETELTHKFCGTSMQTRAWQPLPGLKLGMVDIRANDVELLGTQSAEFTGNVDINTVNMSLSAQSALIDKQRGLDNKSATAGDHCAVSCSCESACVAYHTDTAWISLSLIRLAMAPIRFCGSLLDRKSVV